MSWFYESLSEMEEELDFKPTYCFRSDDEKSAIQNTVNAFERHIEGAFKDWTVYKVFGHQKGEHKYECYENVWEFLRDVAIDYTKTHPQVFFVNKEEEEGVEEEEEEVEEEEEDSDDDFEDCESCGYTHHYEDKCPVGVRCEMYEKWREEEEK
jgi:hypothetical protein